MEIELLEQEKKILDDIRMGLSSILILRIKSNTNAYYVINDFMLKIKMKSKNLNLQINESLSNQNDYTQLKIKKSILIDLIKLRDELKVDSIAKLIGFFIDNHNKELLSLDSLTRIRKIVLNKETEDFLNLTNFYVCKRMDFKYSDITIIYKIDDLIIRNNLEYLDLTNFAEYNFENKNYIFSPKYTIGDLNKFKNIWKRKN